MFVKFFDYTEIIRCVSNDYTLYSLSLLKLVGYNIYTMMRMLFVAFSDRILLHHCCLYR